MDENTSTLQPGLPAVHTQTLMAALVPVVTSITEEATRSKPGQPTKRTDAVLDEICSRLECGQALTMFCNDPAMPGYRTVMEWQRKDADLKERFNQARAEGTFVLDDIAELIARKVPGYASGDFRYDDLLVSVLAQRKRYSNRQRFGDKVQVEHSVQPLFVMPSDAIEGDGY